MNFNLTQILEDLKTNTIEKVAETVTVPVVATSAQTDLEQVLTKQANEGNPEMSNVQVKGRELADAVIGLLKQATDGTPPIAENRVQSETTAMATQSTAGMAETPRVGNSMTQVLQQLVANSAANGAVDPLALYQDAAGSGSEATTTVPLVNKDGKDVNATAEGADDIEKIAAVAALIDGGYSFDEAFDMVKQAAAALEEEEFEQVKIAAVNQLMTEGFSIENAVALVKEAGMFSKKSTATKAVEKAGEIAAGAKEGMKAHAGKIAAGAGAVGGAAGYAAGRSHEKKAAVLEFLLENGVDLAVAIGMVG